ncbi:MAG TPA: ATP-binding protein, partial [Thermodesulfobacteriota bacterium]|nr:ATP-binding protein [Thermodesulfobacteriota bacterium]
MPDVMKDLIAIFKVETEEHLTKLDNGLVELEKQPGNVGLATDLNREVHTLKGAARVFGFCEIQDIAHRIEDIFEEVAAKRAVFSSLIAESIFEGLDAIRAILDRIVQGKEIDVDASGICRELEQCLSGTQGVGLQKTSEGRLDKEERSVESLPEAGQEKNFPTEKAPDEVKERTIETAPTHLPAPMEEYIRVPLSRVDKLLYLVGEVVINKMKASAAIAQTKKLSRLSKEMQRSIFGLSEAMKKEFSPQEGEIAKWISQCDCQMQNLREHALNLHDLTTAQAFHLDPVIDELQANMKKIKMLPFSALSEGFPRMVRDIASQQGKEVHLLISGEETELDKKVLDGIKASLIHILRNCIDHGIEEPEERVTSGKERHGTIKISAYHEADNVMITIQDDGRGMDLDEIRETALKKQLISDHDLDGMSDREILNIVFMNGYSTSPVVTDVSGRGIGLDIVKRDIANLNGRVILDTEKHSMTKFTLALPLTVAIIQVLLVEVSNMIFALPMLPIIETVKVPPDEVAA